MQRTHTDNPDAGWAGRCARRAARRGFTLLETVLAAVLGLMVIVAALSLFTVVQRSDKRSQAKMEENLELASAHKTIARAFHFLLMSDQERPQEGETNEFLDNDDERNNPDLADVEDDGASSKRFYLQPDVNNPVEMTVGTEDRPRRAPSQVFGLTLRDSPIPGDGDKTPEQAWLDQVIHERVMMRASERLNERMGGRSGEAGSGSSRDSGNANAPMSESRGGSDWGNGRNGSGDLRLSLRDRSGSKGKGGSGSSDRDSDHGRSGIGSDGSGLGGDDSDGHDDRTASERLEDAEEERPRAPGVRGVFEVLPDGVDAAGDLTGEGASKVRLEAGDGSPTYSLWWRELPPLEINNDEADPTDGNQSGADGESSGAEKSAESGSLKADEKSGSDSSTSRRSRGSDDSRDSSRARGSRAADGAGDVIDREVQRMVDSSDTTGKRVRLLSGLKTCHWTAFRGRKERDKVWAEFVGHLPAFVELEIVTASGRRENWIFDVAWTEGAEPGSLVAQAPDALNAGVGGLAGLVDELKGQVGDQTNDGTGKPTGDGKGGVGTGTGKGKPNKGGKKGEPTQQDINKIIDDAIRRATQQGGGGGSGKNGK